MLRAAATAAAILVTLLAACGQDDDDEGGGSSSAPPPAAAADLEVVVHPNGPGGVVRERQVGCEEVGPGAAEPVCRRLSADRFAPVAGNMACTAIYGGPSQARVTGTLEGERIDASFSLEDGCEIARWERNRDLLGAPRGP